MTMTMTMTEFNQNPSRASRLAEQGEVRVTRRGRPYLRLVRDDTEQEPESQEEWLQRMYREGTLIPPRRRGPLPPYYFDNIRSGLTPEEAREAIAEFERDRRKYDDLFPV